MFNALPNINFKDSNNFFLIAGPCAIEGEQMAMDIAGEIVEITNELEIPYIFKGSFKKANRSRLDSFTGIGDEKALNILKKVGETYNIPTITDIHVPEDAALAAQVRDQRDSLLVAVDVVVSNPLRWADLSSDKQTEWTVYRQALLDVPQQSGFPSTVVWPSAVT